ncbi:MAG TPA: PAS domain-containing protein [Bacteroidia bacterium]|nr:PAS domain-containing protein [Bacteroidia bacterium]
MESKNKKQALINFQMLFEAAPGLFLILKPDEPNFTILGASNAYLQATMTERNNITGRGLFEVFPDNPDDHTATGTSNLQKSLGNVLKNKAADKMAIQKYDIQRPQSEGGGFEERHWSPLNSPVLNKQNEVEYIIHRVEDVTEFVLLKQKSAKEIETARTELDEKSLFIKNNRERINTILDVLLKYTKLDFSEKIAISDIGDELDAIAIGLNTLSEELVASHEAEELQIQNIKKVNHFLDTILENIPNMVFVKDATELRFVRFNKAGEKLLGYSRKDLMGKNDYDFFPKEQADFFISKDRDALNNKDVTSIPEELIKTAYGEKWLHTKKIPILDEKGKPLYLLGISEDITEKKHSEEQVIKLNNQLHENVVQLEGVNKELESFSYSVSHDLRAPLRAIDGYAGILEEDYGKILDEEGNRLLKNVQYNAKKMGNLIDDLLAFSRLGKKELSKTDLNMNELVEGALYELNKSVKHTATVKIKNLHSAKGDYGLINQVVINLLSNAIKYSSKVKTPLVEISSEKTDNELIYFVKDNGAGFDMRYANKLFGVFQRLHTMEEFEGTGVGLAIVQRIMAKHGGKVSAEGEKNKGAIFKFSLPVN